LRKTAIEVKAGREPTTEVKKEPAFEVKVREPPADVKVTRQVTLRPSPEKTFTEK
jgi:hypothetical protein